jgi:uncharacterized tellurite resistance protein B-like protein
VFRFASNQQKINQSNLNCLPDMFDKIAKFLSELAGPTKPGLDPDDPRLAAVALMVHLVDADGIRTANEVGRLRQIISQAYKLTMPETEALIAQGEIADREAVDFYRFTKIIARALDRDQRRAFVAMMWELVLADRNVGELEGHILWRIAELIGIEQAERVAIRQGVRADLNAKEA